MANSFPGAQAPLFLSGIIHVVIALVNTFFEKCKNFSGLFCSKRSTKIVQFAGKIALDKES